jgi:phosphate uptake regulator
MEIRKLQLIGGSSYMISLPKNWIKANNLNQGDELILQVDKCVIKVYPKKGADDVIRVEINRIPRCDEKFLRRFIYALYIQGPDEIVIWDRSPSRIVAKLSEIVRDLIGMEIIDVTDSKIVMKCLTTTDFDIFGVLRRMSQIICEMIDVLEEYLRKKNTSVLSIIPKLEADADRFYLLAIRLEHRRLKEISCPTRWDEMKQLIGSRIVAKLLEEIADSLYDLSEFVLYVQKDEDVLPILLDLRRVFKCVLDSYFDGDVVLCEDMIEMTENLEEKIFEIRGRDNKVLCKLALESLLDACRHIKSIGEIAFNKAVRETFTV